MIETKRGLTSQQITAYKARTAPEFIALAPKFDWTILNILINKCQKLIEYYGDRDKFAEVTRLIQAESVIHFYWSLKVFNDDNAPPDFKNDAQDYIDFMKGRILDSCISSPEEDEPRTYVDCGNYRQVSIIQPNVSWLK